MKLAWSIIAVVALVAVSTGCEPDDNPFSGWYCGTDSGRRMFNAAGCTNEWPPVLPGGGGGSGAR